MAKAQPPSARSTTAIDQIIAEKVRVRRKELGLSQQGLAALLGITFQQIQKYEKGTNRVAASQLYQMSLALDVSTTYFFEPARKRATKKKSAPMPGPRGRRAPVSLGAAKT